MSDQLITIEKLEPNDITGFRELVNIFKDVFEHQAPLPDDKHLAKVLGNPHFFVLVAKQSREIVGGLTVFVLDLYYEQKPVAYIYDVGVKAAYQGRGIGKLLMESMRDYCSRNGFSEAYVEAETEDTDAVNFYNKTNYTCQMQATHFTYRFHDGQGQDA